MSAIIVKLIGALGMFSIIDDIVEALITPIVEGVVNLFLDVFFEPFARVLAWIFVNFFLRFAIAIPLWNINRLLILIALGVAKFTEVLIDYLFVSAFNILAEDFGLRMLPLVFTIALTLLGMTYVLAAFWMRSTIVVDWKKAFAWLLFAWLFYTFGADAFVESYILERSLGTVMYELALDVNVDTEEALGPFATEFRSSASDLPPEDPVDVFGQTTTGAAWLKYDESIDGIDIAMAYFYADIDDLTTPSLITLPTDFEDHFFGGGIGDFTSILDKDSETIMNDGIAGVVRLFMGVFLNIFAILDQIVSLWIAIGLALTFFMLIWVVLLAFFNMTEPIAKYLVRSWLDFMLLALFSGIIKAIGVFVMLLAADIPHPVIWIAGAALALAIGWFANMQAIDGVTQLMRNIQSSVTSVNFTGGMQVMPGGMGGMYGGMGQMGGMRGGAGGAGGMGGMMAGGPKMMAARAAMGAIGGSGGQNMMGGGGMGTRPTAGMRAIISPSYSTQGGGPMHADTSPTEGRPKQGGAAFGAPAPLNLSPGQSGGSRPGLSATDGRPPMTAGSGTTRPTPTQSGSVLTTTREIGSESGGGASKPSPTTRATTDRRTIPPPPPREEPPKTKPNS